MHDYIVTVKQGKLRGFQNKSAYSKCTYYSFCGIPYAKPPIDGLRFRPPIPCGSWKGILDAQKERGDCIHYAFLFKTVAGVEDCLYLNIHIPEFPPPKEKLKKVIIHIHGGGYTLGSGNKEFYGSPEFIMHKDIIYVNFNYRLHVLGFLNLEIPECPGNAGLKDIALAMKWINQNIKSFGGDPDDITIFGCSSSACAIHLFMLHPQYRHLFHKAIMLGSCITNQAINYCENPLERARQFAQVMGFFDPNPKKILRFLKKKTAEELVEGINILRKFLLPMNRITTQHNLFIPSIEKFPEGAILSENPLNLLHTIDPIPILYGVCDLDGMQSFAQGSPITQLAENFTDAIKQILWMYKMDDDTLKHVSNRIRKFYFGDKPIDEQMCREICNMYCDIWHAEDYISFFDIIHSKNPNTPIYLYEFGFEGSFNIPKRLSQRHLPCVLDGADHGDDYFYLVCTNSNGNVTQNDAIIIEYMADFFTNFAKFGNPNGDMTRNVAWERYTPDNASFMKINLKLESVSGKWNEERTLFWEDLIKYIKHRIQSSEIKDA